MKVILLKSVTKVGAKDEVVEVAQGYAEHALFPKKLAIPATESALALLKRRKADADSHKAVRHALLDQAIATLQDARVVMTVKTNAQGHLFSKLHPSDIARCLADQYHVALDATCLVVPSIKTIGKFPIEVVDDEYRSTFTLELVQAQ